jgi:mevalonate kinase
MDNIERLEELEDKMISVIDNMGEVMKLIAMELKQEKVKNSIIDCLANNIEQIQNIGDELNYIIEELPGNA